MRNFSFASLALVVSVLAVPARGLAQEGAEPLDALDRRDGELAAREAADGAAPEPAEADAARPDPFGSRAASRDHFELTMGFLAGERRFSDLTFSSGAPGALPAELVAPFEAAPFDQVLVLGLRWELRLVVSQLRMTAGFDLPFARYSVPNTTRSHPAGDREHVVTTRALQPWEVRFGIGLEHAFGPLVPFVDLIGAVHGVDATLAIDDRGELGHRAVGFGFSIRPGLRVMTSEWLFVQTSLQIGVGAPVLWDAELSVGFWIG